MTFLKQLGLVALKIITFGAIAAKDAAPIVGLVFGPEFQSLVSGTSSAIITAEATGATALANAGSSTNGAQKAALVISSIEPLALKYAQAVGAPAPTQEQLKGWTDGFVQAFNALGIDLSKGAAAGSLPGLPAPASA
jgi:hypothetical protein